MRNRIGTPIKGELKPLCFNKEYRRKPFAIVCEFACVYGDAGTKECTRLLEGFKKDVL